ncbi:hypothetical protein TSH100_17350 [Azospirillum sp. TSH100]|uniref:O-antigen ligase family protein n=1 Tax=Azospirillum sp. TSH100 TaxID=652764 RepID=UPI000D60D96E|nr:O-antigen ligase family protein [Azospirillum sp. TSH100]PWC84609.1 hypothetical protein TSH100_17350 [Azospirillum sp. TSH100]QCG91048.1 O-antigen ligase family protein [Azospirillum sp. TSH100]
MRLRRLHFWIFLATVSLAPLPLGSNRPLAWTVLAMVMAALSILWPLAVFRERGAPNNRVGPLAIPGVAFLCAAGWAAAQTWLVPPFTIWNPLWTDAAAALSVAPEVVGRIGLAPSAAVDGLVRLSCYALTFWLAYQHGASDRRAYALIDGLALAAALYALYGLAAFSADPPMILWMEKWAYRDDLTSTFVNRNSYATYAGLGLLTVAAAVVRRLGGAGRGRRLLPHLARPTMVYLLALIPVTAALLATGSRGGAAAAAVGITVFVYGLRSSRWGWLLRMAVGAGLAGAVVLAFCLFLDHGATHPASEAADRLRVYVVATGLIAEKPWTGYGLGSFPDVFAMARPAGISQVWLQAHNVYLELALELGIPAAFALLSAIAWGFAVCLRAAFRQGGRRVCASLGCAATALVAVHSLIDFGMQIPAVAVTWAAIAGSAMGCAVRSAPVERAARAENAAAA